MTEATNSTFRLGGDIVINRLGMGVMRLTGQPGNFGRYHDWSGAMNLIREAASLGVNFFDSARAYGPLFADQLLGEALKNTQVVIATKGGVDKNGPGNISIDGSKDTLLREIDEALTNFRRDRIDLFQLHRVDPKTPIEVSMEALMEAREAGHIGHIGLSNISQGELDRALSVGPVASVQNRFNAAEQAESDLVDYTAERNIMYIPYAPLGANPMKHGATLEPRQALQWLLKRSPNIVVIPGTTSAAHMRENVSVMKSLVADIQNQPIAGGQA